MRFIETKASAHLIHNVTIL